MRLLNGTLINAGDTVSFIDSDGETREVVVERRRFKTLHTVTKVQMPKGSLFFCNIGFMPRDYTNAILTKRRNNASRSRKEIHAL